MAGGVQQGQGGLLGVRQGRQRQHGLLGENGNAPGALLGVGVQKGILMVHPAQFAQHTGTVEQALGQGGFAAVHVGQQTDDESFHLYKLLRENVAQSG